MLFLTKKDIILLFIYINFATAIQHSIIYKRYVRSNSILRTTEVSSISSCYFECRDVEFRCCAVGFLPSQINQKVPKKTATCYMIKCNFQMDGNDVLELEVFDTTKLQEISETTSTTTPTTTSGPISSNEVHVLCSKMFKEDQIWSEGYTGNFIFVPVESVNSWEIIVEFDRNVNSLNVYDGITSYDGCRYLTKNKEFNKNKAAGSSFEEKFLFLHSSQIPPPRISYIRFVGSTGPHLVCGTKSC